MISRWMRAAWLLALMPAAALGFETLDSLPWPSTGRFSAYRAEATEPWSLWAYAGAMYDDNVLRRATAERSDTILRYGAGIRSTGLIYGRQRALLEAYGEYHDYWDLNALDHFAYGLRGEWLWELGNQLSGSAGYRRIRRLADVAESGTPTRITEDRFHALGGYRFAADWRLIGGAEYAKLDREARLAGETASFSVRGGIEHVSPLGNAIGLIVRHTQGEAPVSEELGIGSFPNNEVTEREIAATLSYALGPQLRVGGRAGRTERTYSELPGRDFSGTTGRGMVEWLPGAKISFLLEAYREPTALIDADALHVIRRGVSFGPSWAPTIKLVFSARLLNERRIAQGDPAVELAGAPLRDETIRVLRFGVGWEPQRRWQLSTAIDHGERESNILGRDFDYTAYMLNLRFTY